MLPKLLYPNKDLSTGQRKWTTMESLKMFDNGLISNSSYYKELRNGRGYIVTYDPHINFSLKEILVADFVTLNENVYLSSFVIDHCINVFNRINGNKFQIISVAKSSIIFGDTTLTKPFVDGINFLKGDIAMPVCLYNHYVLVMYSSNDMRLTLIDPLANESIIGENYRSRFQKFMQIKQESPCGIKLSFVNHVKQADSYNCGTFVVYFFERLVRGESLTYDLNTAEYRSHLKDVLLQNSVNMKQLCLYCCQIVDITNSFQCRSCVRYIHDKCLLSVREIEANIKASEKTMNNICDLCREN